MLPIFDEDATNLIENDLSERTQRVVLNGIESDWINLKRGVSQSINLDCRNGLHGLPVRRCRFSIHIRHC